MTADADHAIRTIRARCGETLSPGDLALVEAALSGGDDPGAISGEILERIVDVLDALESRLDRMEAAT